MGDHRVSEVRRLANRAELSEAGAHHPVLRWDVGLSLVAPAYAVGEPGEGAVAYRRRGQSGALGSALLGTEPGIEALLDDDEVRAWVTGPDVSRVSIPRNAYPALQGRLPLVEWGTWEWMWTRSAPPPQPAEPLLVRLGPDRKAEVTTFLEEHNPRTFGQPFARPAQLWVGVRDVGGALAAVGSSEANTAGSPHLSGITVAPRHRGQGLGAAVTAYLTREALERAGVCTLGMYADNTVARRIYHRLGYLTAITWTTGGVAGGGADGGA